MKRVYSGWIKEIRSIIDETDFSKYNFETQKTITLPRLGELRVNEGTVDYYNNREEYRKKYGRTKAKKNTGSQQCDCDHS